MSVDTQSVCPRCAARYPANTDRCPTDGRPLCPIPGSADPLVGTCLVGRYTVLSPLGKGGFGCVYRALQHPLGREVAIKLLHADLTDDQATVAQFLREGEIIVRLRNEHTITVHSFEQTSKGRLFLVMELGAGRSLGVLLHEEKRLTPARAASIAAQVCESLEEAHREGIVHRDLKPGNVLIEEREGSRDFVKVLDFGLAKDIGSDSADTTTTGGVVRGTPAYLAPEQVLGEKLTPAVDLYALGAMLFRMLAGRLVFTAQGPMKQAMAHANEPAPDIRDLVPGLSERFASLVMSLLAKDPDDRPPSAEAVRSSLLDLANEAQAAGAGARRGSASTDAPDAQDEVQHTEPLATVSSVVASVDAPGDAESRTPSWRRRSFAAVSALLVGVLLVVGALLLHELGQSESPAPVSAVGNVEPPEAPPVEPPANGPLPGGPSAVVQSPAGGGIGSQAPPAEVHTTAPPPPAEVRPRGAEGDDPPQRRERHTILATLPRPVEVRVSVQSDPPGALVVLGKKQLGRTPLDVRVARVDGTQSLKLTLRGYRGVRREVSRALDLSLHFKLKPRRPDPHDPKGLIQP